MKELIELNRLTFATFIKLRIIVLIMQICNYKLLENLQYKENL